MNKLGVFVEGYTEVVFVERLVEEIAGAKDVLIEHWKIRGGKKVPRVLTVERAAREPTGQKQYVLIFDCGGDIQVKTRIMEEHANLTRAGYSKLIGLRDVDRKSGRAGIPRLAEGLPKYINASLIPVEFILAVMEIEAWFLAEATHFPRIDPAITVAAIRATLGFDPEADDMELRDEPAKDMIACYRIGGKVYQKDRVKDTIEAMDFDQVYFSLVDRFVSLRRLVSSIEAFLA